MGCFRRLLVLPAVLAAAGALVLFASPGSASAPGALRSAAQTHALSTTVNESYGHAHIDCTAATNLCAEVFDTKAVLHTNWYVGHDEPSLLFYSNTTGSGNQMRYTLTLPSDPPPNSTPGAATYNFELRPAFWFGIAMCATQSYPNTVRACLPDSNANIVNPAVSPYHPGTAFMEMQFYPPGWVDWPAGISCSATQWCAALNIDSLAENPVSGTSLNPGCAARTGLEYVNFAFITLDGKSQAPANPIDATAATYTPDPTKDLFMGQGNRIVLTMHDTSSGLGVYLDDVTTGQTGSMVASAANGFGQVKYAPAPSTLCQNMPYDFHPMYSTSTPQTRVIWAAHTYNIAYSDEIGHFDFCSHPTTSGGCTGTEGAGSNTEPTDTDDLGCFPASDSSLVKVSGCIGENVPGYDGTSYLNDWPNGSATTPTPVELTSPLTGDDYNINYPQVGFETDLPRIEEGLYGCDPFTASGCTHRPITDDGTIAPFYPFYSTAHLNGCEWIEAAPTSPLVVNDFGKWNEYGGYDKGVDYLGSGGAPYAKADDFRHILANPCLTRP